MIKTLKDILLQLIPVAVGVYIGILAGNWNEQKNHRQYQEVFLENIAKEMTSNKAKMEVAKVYHKNLGKGLDSLLNDSNLEFLNASIFSKRGFNLIPGWNGVKIPGLENSIYESGLISNAFNGLDFETIIRFLNFKTSP